MTDKIFDPRIIALHWLAYNFMQVLELSIITLMTFLR